MPSQADLKISLRLIITEFCHQSWNFNNNSYCLGKHLTEQLVASYHGVRFPVAIVRPSLVLAVAGKPYPGYVGNLAGACKLEAPHKSRTC